MVITADVINRHGRSNEMCHQLWKKPMVTLYYSSKEQPKEFYPPFITYIVQQEYWVNLKLIATKANSADFDLLLWPQC